MFPGIIPVVIDVFMMHVIYGRIAGRASLMSLREMLSDPCGLDSLRCFMVRVIVSVSVGWGRKVLRLLMFSGDQFSRLF